MLKLHTVDAAPRDLKVYSKEWLHDHDPGEMADKLTDDDVARIREIFNTPLTGSYNWDYTEANQRIKRLYELGKQHNWNAELDVDWSIDYPHSEYPSDPNINPYAGYEPYERMSDEEKLEFAWHNFAWTLSQFLHGEQGALLVASQLVSCAPTHDAKLYAGSQTFDEARHVEVFAKYIKEKLGIMYPVSPSLKLLLDKVLTDPRWDLKFIGMQLIIEGLALAAFNTMRMTTYEPLCKNIVELVIRDEGRHVAFGVNYLEEYIRTLPEDEIEARAEFAYEACVVMRERLIATDVFEHFGWDVEEARRRTLDGEIMQMFRNLLFERIIPNLKRVGLLTEKIRPKFEELGILEYENLAGDGLIDWAELEKPLPIAVRDAAE